MHKLRNNYTAPLYLPHAGKLEGIMVPVGESDLTDKHKALLDELAQTRVGRNPRTGEITTGVHPIVKGWFDSKLLEVVYVEDAAPADPNDEAAKQAAAEAAAKAEADAKAAAEAEAAKQAAAEAATAPPALPPLDHPKSEG